MAPRDPRHLLIKEVWPDKLLYGTLLIVVSSFMGFLHGLLVLTTDLAVTARPGFLAAYPILWTVAFSLAAFVLALASWHRLSVGLGVLAAICGIASLSLFGIGALHAAAALVFLGLARYEQEDKIPPVQRVNKWQWPDKAFAASLLLLLAGTTGVSWGALVLLQLVGFGGEHQVTWGALQIVAGVVAVIAAELLYHQKAPLFGVAACGFCIATSAGYVLAPGLALAAVVAILLAWREHEFSGVPLHEIASTRSQPPPP